MWSGKRPVKARLPATRPHRKGKDFFVVAIKHSNGFIECEWQSCTVCGRPVYTTSKPSDALCDECMEENRYCPQCGNDFMIARGAAKGILCDTCNRGNRNLGERTKCNMCGSIKQIGPEFGLCEACSAKQNRKRKPISNSLRIAVYKRSNFQCVKCGENDIEKLTLDHINPFSKGGEDTLENLQALCKSCNSRKGNR